MGDGTAIQWTDATWNPVYGCTKVSAGCKNCYAEGVLPRLRLPFDRITLREDDERLYQPLRWNRPRMVFVNSLSDLFHEDVPDGFIARVFAVMALAYWHTFQVLTKRSARRSRLLRSEDFWQQVNEWIGLMLEDEDCPVGPGRGWNGLERRSDDARATAPDPSVGEPLPNVWLGDSVEDQAAADERIPELLTTPAAVRFLSCEPLLGPVNLDDITVPEPHGEWHFSALAPDVGPEDDEAFRGAHLNWVIVGGESGPRARPMEDAWARSVVEQCRGAGVPVFVKQLGRVWAVESSRARGEPWCDDLKGGDPDVWPADLRVRQMPEVHCG